MTVLNESQQERLKEITTNLRKIRQENSISLEQIAMQTHIRLACLQALEEWRFEELPEPVFIQGFIRRYADKLGLDGTAIANSFEVNIIHLPKNVHKPSSFYVPLFVPYIFLLIGASVGLFYLMQSDFTDKSLNKTQKPILDVKENVASSSPSQPIPKLISKLTPSPRSTPNTNVAVTLELKGNSWIKVNADGKTEFEGILNKGKRLTWTAKNSLTVRSGNAGAVLVSVNQAEPQLLGNQGEVKEVTYSN